MARLEDAQKDLDSLTAQVAAADERLAALGAARDARTADLDAELGSLAARARPGRRRAARRTCSRSTTGCAPPRAASARRRSAPASAAAAGSSLDPSELAAIRAAAPRRGGPAARSASGSWCARPSRGCDATAYRVPRSGHHRGRRRLARQPRPGGVRRGAEGRRHRRGDRRGRHHDRGRDQQRRGVLRPDRRAQAGRGVRPGRRHRGPDGLQARRRADVGPLEDQAPRHAAAATEANRLAPFGTTYTWVPREQNKHADRLANEALDGKRSGVTAVGAALVDEPQTGDAPIEEIEEPGDRARRRRPGAGPPRGRPTTLVLVRHGVTPHTAAKRFSGGLASANPGLSDEGRDQIRTTADWLAPIAEGIDAVVASPVRRTLESAEILAERRWARRVDVEPGFAEMEFGALGRADLRRGRRAGPGRPRRLARLAGHAAAGRRVVPRGRGAGARRARPAPRGTRRPDRRRGQPRDADQDPGRPARSTRPLESVFRMELSPASVSVVSFFPEVDGAGAAPRCGSTTPGRPATTRSPRPRLPGAVALP